MNKLPVTFTTLCLIVITLPAQAEAQTEANAEICANKTTLNGLVDCIESHMPMSVRSFTTPSIETRSEWRAVVRKMLEGKCSTIKLPLSLSANYVIKDFQDQNDKKKYCVLMESLDENQDGKVDLGWGTFITNPQFKRNINITAPHSIYDVGTAQQGIRVFQGVQAHSFLMNGIYRYASSKDSTCQGPGNYDYPETDEAHNVNHVFHETIVEMKNYYEANGIDDYYSIQFHGLGNTTCVGMAAYMTNGLPSAPPQNSIVRDLQNNVEEASDNEWRITVPGETPYCSMNGGSNVQGRLINGVTQSSVCTRDATKNSGKFIHIEQHWDSRDTANVQYWINGFKATFPENEQ